MPRYSDLRGRRRRGLAGDSFNNYLGSLLHIYIASLDHLDMARCQSHRPGVGNLTLDMLPKLHRVATAGLGVIQHPSKADNLARLQPENKEFDMLAGQRTAHGI